MLVEKEILDKLCPSYRDAIQKLEKEYDEIPEDKLKEKRLLLFEFFKNYLMLRALWNVYFE